MAIEHFSYAPAVRVGTALDFARRDGSAHHAGFIGTENDWTFSIEGWVSDVWYASRLETVHAAQDMLFTHFSHRIEHWCKEQIGQGKVGAALKLAELKGRWQATDLSRRKHLYEDEAVLVH